MMKSSNGGGISTCATEQEVTMTAANDSGKVVKFNNRPVLNK